MRSILLLKYLVTYLDYWEGQAIILQHITLAFCFMRHGVLCTCDKLALRGELLVKEIAVDVDKPRLHVKCKEVGEDRVKTV